MILTFFKLILATLLIWPRGYLLAYIIDRSKNFSFGFKFFAGWFFGLAAFTLDIFAANVLGGFKLDWWVFYFSVFGQIFGFEFLIFILEKKIILPKPKNLRSFLANQLNNFKLWRKSEKIILVIFILAIFVQIILNIWLVNKLVFADLSRYQVERIFFQREILPTEDYFLNDILFKVWLAESIGDLSRYIFGFAGIFYSLMLLLIFYFSLPQTMNNFLKMIATYLLSNISAFYFYFQLDFSGLCFSIFLFLIIAGLFYFLIKRGNSFFYFSGIALAFAIWTSITGLAIIFPLILITTFIFLILRLINLKNLFFYWFWPVITVWAWLYFVFSQHSNVFSDYLESFSLLELAKFSLQLLPLLILLLAFISQAFFDRMKIDNK